MKDLLENIAALRLSSWRFSRILRFVSPSLSRSVISERLFTFSHTPLFMAFPGSSRFARPDNDNRAAAIPFSGAPRAAVEPEKIVSDALRPGDPRHFWILMPWITIPSHSKSRELLPRVSGKCLGIGLRDNSIARSRQFHAERSFIALTRDDAVCSGFVQLGGIFWEGKVLGGLRLSWLIFLSSLLIVLVIDLTNT